jgi:exodeoxyribonuclease-3
MATFMKVATWNVNSLRVRLPQVLAWLAGNPVDLLAIQETKLSDNSFPQAEIEAAGYQVAFAGQKTYNGVALLSRQPLTDVQIGIPGYRDEQKRVIAANCNGARIINLYVPNGQAVGSEKYQYKLIWLETLHGWLGTELRQHPQIVVLGDFNIAPADEDVYDPAAWKDQVLCSEPEREAFRSLLALGYRDCFRLFPQETQSYSWWDYRAAAFRRNLGLRIDHILANAPFAQACASCVIDKTPRKQERPSDHVPVIAEFRAT